MKNDRQLINIQIKVLTKKKVFYFKLSQQFLNVFTVAQKAITHKNIFIDNFFEYREC